MFHNILYGFCLWATLLFLYAIIHIWRLHRQYDHDTHARFCLFNKEAEGRVFLIQEYKRKGKSAKPFRFFVKNTEKTRAWAEKRSFLFPLTAREISIDPFRIPWRWRRSIEQQLNSGAFGGYPPTTKYVRRKMRQALRA
ncbi:MAG TPA: hypothetical protein VEA18_00275 [Candidatus Kapabacteria bacterium]|nr:hypothetical protein [Candidatus Kapabacteria bacterium]